MCQCLIGEPAAGCIPHYITNIVTRALCPCPLLCLIQCMSVNDADPDVSCAAFLHAVAKLDLL